VAIIHCPHCGMQISSSAVNCPCCRGVVAEALVSEPTPPSAAAEAPARSKEGASIWASLLGAVLAGVLTWAIFSIWSGISALNVIRFLGSLPFAAFALASDLLGPVLIKPILLGAVLFIAAEQVTRHKGKYARLGGCIAVLVTVLAGYLMMRLAWGNVLRSGVIGETQDELRVYAESLLNFYYVGVFLLQGGLSLAGYGRRLLWRLLFTVIAAALAALLIFFLPTLLVVSFDMGVVGVGMAGTATGIVVLAVGAGAAMTKSE